MNLDRIKYTDFISKENYCELQEYFGSYDYKSEYSEIKEPLEDFKIIFKDYDEFEIEDYLEKEFLKDFLKPGISKMNDRYFAHFKETMERKAILTKESRCNFLKLYRTKIKSLQESIQANEDLNVRIIASLGLKLVELDGLLVEHIDDDPYPEIKEKIQFKWKRADVLYFFHLMRDKKEIIWIADVDLGRIIDRIFQYVDDDGNAKDIKGSNRHITDYKNNDPGRNETYPRERLKKVFLDIFN